jgi:adenosylmethionine---8-amino-7-oxononanoate aminotransferase
MTAAATNPIWHPFTQMKIAAPPIEINSAKDTLLYATDGRQFIDAISSWWVNLHGHCNPVIAQAIAAQAQQLEQVIFAGFTHAPAQRLAQRLVEVLPDTITKIFFSDNGSTAVEVALKLALQYWHNQGITHKTKIVAFENAYHGDTFGAMSVGGRSAFSAAYEPLLFEVAFLPTPHPGNRASVLAQMTDLLAQGDVAALIFEPLVQGAGGMLMYAAQDLDALVALAQAADVICIADEVMTGFGRTGKTFACDHLQHKPDLMCLSKGITGGFMPLGVTACAQYIYDAFYSDAMSKTFFHGHSYTANPLACAAANASLELLLAANCQQQIAAIVARHAAFAHQVAVTGIVKEIRQQGTILAIEFATQDSTSYFHPLRDEIYDFCLSRGVLIRPLGNVAYLMPPYCISEAELTTVYGVLTALIDSLNHKYLPA